MIDFVIEMSRLGQDNAGPVLRSLWIYTMNLQGPYFSQSYCHEVAREHSQYVK